MKVIVDAEALRQLLTAVQGPGHLIREIQFTTDICAATGMDNPINTLIKEFNEQAEPKFMKFKDLPMGARFKYPDGTGIWVVIRAFGQGLIAKWEGLNIDRSRQSLCSFCDDEWTLDSEVEVLL